MNPPRKPTEKTVTISVRLPESIYKQVQQIAIEEQRSLNQVIIRLLAKILETKAGE